MARSVRISEEAARVALGWIPESADYPSDKKARANISAALARLDRAPKRPPKSRKASPRLMQAFKVLLPASRKPSKSEKREERSEIRDRCVVRSDGRCENPDCRRTATPHYPAHWDHFFGRKRAESVETSWMLCPDCDYLKTHNDPDAATWYRRFIRHVADLPPTRAYRAAKRRAEDRLAFIETRASLPAAPRTTP